MTEAPAAPSTGQGNRRATVQGIEAVVAALAVFFMLAGGTRLLLTRQWPTPLWAWLIGAILPTLFLLLAACFISRTWRLQAFARPLGGQWLRCAAVMALGLAGGMWIGQTPWDSLTILTNPAARALWCLTWVGMAAPLAEEAFFRGVLVPILKPRLDGPGSAVIIAAGAFMLAHVGLPGLWLWFALGVGFGVAMLFGGTMWAAVAAHVGWNLGTVALAAQPQLQGLWPMLLGIGALLVVASFVRHR